MVKLFQLLNLLKMEKIKNFLFSLFVATIVFSCTHTEDQSTPFNEVENLTEKYFESNFSSLSNIFIESFESQNTIESLLESAKLEKNAGEVEINLLEEASLNSNYNNAVSSKLLSNARTTKDKFNVETIFDFISKNDIEIHAPYMAENFDQSTINEITLTYYYPGMYGNKTMDPNFKGETPGIKYQLDKNGAVIKNSKTEVITNDEYAQKHPTIVFMPNSMPLSSEESADFTESLKKQGITNENKVTNSPLCTDLTGVNEILTVRMPKLKLRKNFRSWPSPNEMYLWISNGTITTGSNGLPVVSTQTANPLVKHKVSRSDASNKAWVSSNTTFLVHNLNYEAQDIHVVWGCQSSEHTLTVTASISVKDGVATPTYTVSSVSKPGVLLISSVIYNKCALLYSNRYDVNQGFNFFDGYPVYNFNDIWTYFTFDKYNY